MNKYSIEIIEIKNKELNQPPVKNGELDERLKEPVVQNSEGNASLKTIAKSFLTVSVKNECLKETVLFFFGWKNTFIRKNFFRKNRKIYLSVSLWEIETGISGNISVNGFSKKLDKFNATLILRNVANCILYKIRF